MANNIYIGIIDGPTTEQLLSSLCTHVSEKRSMVIFTMEDGLKNEGSINSLMYEDGSGNSFCFGGYFDGANNNAPGRFFKGTLADISIIMDE